MPSPKDPVVAPSKHRVRSTLSFIFNPHIGESVKPLRDTTHVFVNLIAMLFVMYRLFPKDHPAFAPNSPVRLSLMQVIQTAWSNVTFTKETAPQTLFFFAVVGSMAITVLLAFFAACSLFMGHAHAAVSMFTAPGGNGAGSTDLGQNLSAICFRERRLRISIKTAVTALHRQLAAAILYNVRFILRLGITAEESLLSLQSSCFTTSQR